MIPNFSRCYPGPDSLWKIDFDGRPKFYDLLCSENSLTKTLLTILELENLVFKTEFQLSSTRITNTSATCIDFIAVDRSLSLSRYTVSDFLLSDHHPVEADIDVISNSNIVPIMRRSFKNINFSELGLKISEIQLNNLDDPQLFENQLELWNYNFISILDDFAPLRSYPCSKKKPTWVDKNTRGLMRLRTSLARKIRTGSFNYDDFEMLGNLKRCIKSRVRASIKNHGKRIISNDDPKETWKYIRRTTFTQAQRSSYLPEIEEVNRYFADLVGEDPSQKPPIVNCENHDVDTVKFEILPFNCNKIEKLLQRLKVNTAAGPDDIPAYLLRRLAHFIAPNVTLLYNASILNCIFPSSWKNANISAIYKNKGSKSNVENYRPISVLPILGRTLEKAVGAQLQQYCDVEEIIPIQQFGFRKHSSCEMALLAATDSWINNLADGKLVGALLIDLSKAFDSISHAQLIQDLTDIGCADSALRWFASFLTARQQRVKLGPSTARWMPVDKGVPQGSPLSPLLFNIVVRHIPHACDSDVFQFADDLTSSVSDIDFDGLASKLQSTYSRVKSFCEDRMLHINLTKTQLIIFKPARRKLPDNFGIILDNIFISPSPSVKLLGVTLDQHLTMGPHIEAVVKKCQGLLGMLRRASVFLPREILNLVYISLIRSHLEYCSATFINSAQTHLRKLDIIQKIASRVITASPAQTHSAPLQILLGLDSLHARRLTHVSTLVEDILHGKSHPYFRDFFREASQSKVSSATNKTLRNKSFSHFGISSRIEFTSSLESTSSLEANSCSLDLTSWGLQPSHNLSRMSITASSSSTVNQQNSEDQVARVRIEPKEE